MAELRHWGPGHVFTPPARARWCPRLPASASVSLPWNLSRFLARWMVWVTSVTPVWLNSWVVEPMVEPFYLTFVSFGVDLSIERRANSLMHILREQGQVPVLGCSFSGQGRWPHYGGPAAEIMKASQVLLGSQMRGHSHFGGFVSFLRFSV